MKECTSMQQSQNGTYHCTVHTVKLEESAWYSNVCTDCNCDHSDSANNRHSNSDDNSRKINDTVTIITLIQ